MRNLFKLILTLTIALATNANAMEIGIGKGQIITLQRPAAHVFVANPDIADIDVRSPNYIYIYGLKAGETSLHALDANSQQIIDINIIVTHNMSSLNKIIKEVVPSSKVKFTSVDTSMIMQGEVDTPDDAQKVLSIVTASIDPQTKLVNMLKVRGSDQVMLKVKVAEISRSTLKNFGINLANAFNSSNFAFSLLTGRVPVDPTTGLFIRNGDNINIGGRIGNFDLNGVIDALETQGLVKTLAEPNMTAKSGEAASFLAGGEYPIPVPQQNGVTTIQYKEFGVRLDFTPTVLSNTKINLKVAPEVSSLTASSVSFGDGTVIPSLSTRRASTTVELGSGESFAVAGLLSNDSNNNVNKFPWLGDIPILGALFKSTQFQTDETELVIIVTPYIVHGARESDKLLSPTDGFEQPSDFQRILLGKTYVEKEPGANPKAGRQTLAKYKLNGDAGYMLEE